MLTNSVYMYININHNPSMRHACGMRKVNFALPFPLAVQVIKQFINSCIYLSIIMHLGSLESTQKASALGCTLSNPCTFLMFSKPSACIITQ